MKNSDAEQRHLKSTYTKTMHELCKEFELNASEKLFMCALCSMANDKPNQELRLNHEYFEMVCCVTDHGLRMVIRRLIAGGLVLRPRRGVYKAGGHFRRAWARHDHNIAVNGGHEAAMRQLKNAR